jgi:glycosyltransferase involved in cell wall biosynthesis
MSVYLGLSRQLRDAISNSQPDLVHCMYGGVMADIATRAIKDRPVIISFCGSDLLGERLCGPVRRLISNYGIRCSHRAAKRADGIIVKSKNLGDVLPPDAPLSKVRIVPNGVDLNRFKPLDRDSCRQQLGWRPDCLHVLFPKNVNDPQTRADLARVAVEVVQNSGVNIDIHHLQGIPHEEIPVWLNASDTVILTSIHEGSPNIVKEALACDVPVVSVDVGDVRERIRRVHGCYLALPTANDLASKLQLVAAGPRRVAGRIAVKELSLERISARVIDFYRDVLDLRRAKGSTPKPQLSAWG